MNKNYLIQALLAVVVLLLTGAVTPSWAQKKSYKSRSAKLSASAAARSKAERARRAEASAKAAAAAPITSGADVDELMRIEEAWAQATLNNSAEVITHILADEYVAVNSQGLVSNKADVLAAIANDEVKCDINKGFEYIVRVYGNSGLVIHNTSFRGVMSGTNTSGEYRTLHMYVKRSGKWLVVANQTTYVVPERITLVSKKDSKDNRERKRKRGDVAGQ
jgi:ketosteroid isomerase-like protein